MGKTDCRRVTADRLAIVALGSNLSFGAETPSELLDAARRLLKKRGCAIRRCSRYFATPAFPAGSGPDFVNAVAVLDYDGGAAALLAHLHAVEAQMGRERVHRWGARTLDLDLIACGACVLPDAQTHAYWRDLPPEDQQARPPPELILPHPRMSERAFVLVPMMDVAPDWVHPLTHQTVRQMCDALPHDAVGEVIAL